MNASSASTPRSDSNRPKAGATAQTPQRPRVTIDRADFQSVIDALISRGYLVMGPTVRDSAIVHDQILRVDQLPSGWSDTQEAGKYRLWRRSDEALFGYTVGPQSWKALLHPPTQRLWRARREGRGLILLTEPAPEPRLALLGVRSCDLAAMLIQDRVFLGGEHVDPAYRRRREEAFIVAVGCTAPGELCFCASVDAGPAPRAGFDLSLVELIDAAGHRFVAQAGTERGAELLDAIPHRAAGEDAAIADGLSAAAVLAMGRTLDAGRAAVALRANPEHPQWDDVAARCLGCTNCTMVCPTCFCTTVEDVTDLSGNEIERRRRWDSCFTLDYSYIHGGSVRRSARARYRQWLTHKLSSWHEQFGTAGCVGCGRCIAWCPAAIDLTVEARALDQPLRPAAAAELGGN